MVLFHYIVEILALSESDSSLVDLIVVVDRCRVAPTLVSRNLLWLAANIPLRAPLRSAVAEKIVERDLELPPLLPLPQRPPKNSREPDEGGAWTMGGDPQEIIAGDFPISSR